MDKAQIIASLRESLPLSFPRSDVDELLGGILSSKTLANYKTLQCAPPSFKLNKRVCFMREPFLEWLEARITVEEE